MLFAYTFVQHELDRMQEFIDFIFLEVWCEAPQKGDFDFNLFAGNPDLSELVTALHYADDKGAYFFNSRLQIIYEIFKQLGTPDIEQLKIWYRGNNDLEKVCANDPDAQIVRYVDILAFNKDLHDQLAPFFKNLYSSSFLGLASVVEKVGKIDDRYNKFVQVNSEGKCPFCGIEDLLSEYHSKREAYDHYLPKALYPFNSINFGNLIPACHKCNSSYKTSKDPAHPVKDPAGGAVRRRFFFPYEIDKPAIQIALTIEHCDYEALTPDNITLQFGPAEFTEEIETWREVYGVDERYKAKVVGKNDGKYWIVQCLEEWACNDLPPEAYLGTLTSLAGKSPFAEVNFLKLPFLEACHIAGILTLPADCS